MRDVPSGWLLRYMHANGASLFFIVVYLHVFRGMYYSSYAKPRELVWIIGVVILLLMILTAFIGLIGPKWLNLYLLHISWGSDNDVTVKMVLPSCTCYSTHISENHILKSIFNKLTTKPVIVFLNAKKLVDQNIKNIKHNLGFIYGLIQRLQKSM